MSRRFWSEKGRKKRHHKHYRRRKGDDSEKPRFQHTKARFPRLLRYPRLPDGHEDDVQLIPLIRQMREEYPAPYYNPARDGAWNPAEAIIHWLAEASIEKLQEKCLYHGLDDTGTRFQMIKAMYLHYRSSILKLGFPLTAYGPYHENANPTGCNCGKMKKHVKRFPRLPNRFPRTIRFPRLHKLNFSEPSNDGDWLKVYFKEYRKLTGRKLRKSDILYYVG